MGEWLNRSGMMHTCGSRVGQDGEEWTRIRVQSVLQEWILVYTGLHKQHCKEKNKKKFKVKRDAGIWSPL